VRGRDVFTPWRIRGTLRFDWRSTRSDVKTVLSPRDSEDIFDIVDDLGGLFVSFCTDTKFSPYSAVLLSDYIFWDLSDAGCDSWDIWSLFGSSQQDCPQT
jgi:hypothetical protein